MNLSVSNVLLPNISLKVPLAILLFISICHNLFLACANPNPKYASSILFALICGKPYLSVYILITSLFLISKFVFNEDNSNSPL